VIVVLDSGVWVSALEFGGTPARALEQALTLDQIAISEFIEFEVSRVLVHKFGWEQSDVEEEMNEYLSEALRVQTTGSLDGTCRDPNDDRVLETAVNANARYLVAGDKDLLALKSFSGTDIVTPAEYLHLGTT
jgi:putative PIN family toxin of toxin-antitoxin system